MTTLILVVQAVGIEQDAAAVEELARGYWSRILL